MMHANARLSRMVALAIVAMVGAAVMASMGPAGTAPTDHGLGGSAALAPSDNPGPESARAAALSSSTLDQGGNNLEPLAICRLRPQCSSDADCDALCGVGLGNCVHSNCPVRICRCR